MEARAALSPGADLDAIEAAVLARILLEDIRRETRARGLPSDEELAVATQRRWVELDRPSSSRTTHAVALVKRPEQRAEAREVAQRIARATRGARDAEDFKRRALAVNPGAIGVVVEALPPITEDGRAVPVGTGADDGPGKYDVRFARACNAIARPGEQSEVVESDFGWHVIRLEERLPAVRMSVEERRRAVSAEVYRARASREREQLLKALRARTRVVVTRNATELAGLLKAAP
ncbi:MAG: peptidylprolyl isomerase [Polyangiaceae bacterium]|nr:peptidylprolyl isomerase [Polyangiaceae bacterium]